MKTVNSIMLTVPTKVFSRSDLQILSIVEFFFFVMFEFCVFKSFLVLPIFSFHITLLWFTLPLTVERLAQIMCVLADFVILQ